MTSTQHTSEPSAASTQSEAIDLGRLLGILLDHKWLILIVTLAFGAAGVFRAMVAPPVYQADALVQVERRSSINPLGDFAQIAGQQDASQSTSAEVQILQSRMVLGQVVDSTDIDTEVIPTSLPLVGDFFYRRGIPRPELMAGRPEVWGDERLVLGRFELEGQGGLALVIQALGDERFAVLQETEEGRRKLGQGRVGESLSLFDGAVQLRLADLQAAPGAEFTVIKRSRQGAISRLFRQLRVTELSGSGGTTGMLRLVMTGGNPTEIRTTLDAVAQTFMRQNVERQSAEAQQSLEFLQEQAPELRAQLASAEDALNEYRTSLESVDLSSESQAAIQQFIELESRLNELELEEAELAERFTPSHPRYQSLLRQRRQLQSERSRLETELNNLPAAQQEIVRLTRDMEVTQAIYVNVLNKIQELQLARAGTVGNVRIIDEAVVSGQIAPNQLRIIQLALILGLMVAVGGVLLRGLLRRGVESPEQIEQLELPVYATIPLSPLQEKLGRKVKQRHQRQHIKRIVTGVLAEKEPADGAIEALRGLRTSLHFAMLETSDNRLVITGPSPGIGKSFISINLAAVCAQAGQRVLVVDADMRKGQLHYALGGRGENGLSELLSGRTQVEEVLRNSSVEGLDYITRGTPPPNPSELLMQPRFTSLLDELSQRYDLVIIDTPPLLAVTDATIVGAQCGTSLLVARYQFNSPKELQLAKRRLESSGVHLRGAILNAMEQRASTYYGYGYYHYSYK